MPHYFYCSKSISGYNFSSYRINKCQKMCLPLPSRMKSDKKNSISVLLPGTELPGFCFPGLVNVGCLFCFDKHQLISPLFHLRRNGFPSYQIISTSVSHSTIYTFLTQLMNWLVMEHAKGKKNYQTSFHLFQATSW